MKSAMAQNCMFVVSVALLGACSSVEPPITWGTAPENPQLRGHLAVGQSFLLAAEDPVPDSPDEGGAGAAADCAQDGAGPELCNGQDDDCDGTVDEDYPLLTLPCGVALDPVLGMVTWSCAPGGQKVLCDAAVPENSAPLPVVAAPVEPQHMNGACFLPLDSGGGEPDGPPSLLVLPEGKLSVAQRWMDFEYYGAEEWPSITWSLLDQTIRRAAPAVVTYEELSLGSNWVSDSPARSIALSADGFFEASTSFAYWSMLFAPRVKRTGNIEWSIELPKLAWADQVLTAAHHRVYSAVFWSSTDWNRALVNVTPDGVISSIATPDLPLPLSALAARPDGTLCGVGQRSDKPIAFCLRRSGELLWQIPLTATPKKMSWHRSRLVARPDGGLFVVLPTTPLVVMSLDSGGAMIWARALGESSQTEAEVAAAGDGVLVTARNSSQGSVWLLSPDGKSVSTRGLLPPTLAGAAALGPSGHIIVAGTTYHDDANHLAITRFPADGSLPAACEASGRIGDYCGGDDLLCQEGLACHELSGSRCYPPLGQYADCVDDSECKSGLLCSGAEAAMLMNADCDGYYDDCPPYHASCIKPQTSGYCSDQKACAPGTHCNTCGCKGTMGESNLCKVSGECCPDYSGCSQDVYFCY